jgi:ferrous iron transport protein A
MIERLKEMGLHQGLEVSFVGRAPFRGPLLYRFGNTVLALRLEEASCALI